MNAAICDEVPADLTAVKTYAVTGVVEAVTCRAASAHPAEGEERFRVSLLDYGAKRNIVRELQKRGCTVTVLPAQTSAEEVLAAKPDGVMLSNGPGDPAENVYQIEQIKKLLGKVPLFGICLGHQLTALAVGGGTYKLKYGHRGVNQPVRDLATPWTVPACRWGRSASSTPTTAPARASTIRTCGHSRSSSIQRPAPGPRTHRSCSTNL